MHLPWATIQLLTWTGLSGDLGMSICVHTHVHREYKQQREVSNPLLLRILFGDLALQEFVHLAFWKSPYLQALLLNVTSNHIAQRVQHWCQTPLLQLYFWHSLFDLDQTTRFLWSLVFSSKNQDSNNCAT